MTDRADRKRTFLDSAGWGDAKISVLAGDASTRSYDRVEGAQGRAVLMDAPRDAEAPACPPNATIEDRQRLGYNALACLAGPDSASFVAIADYLNSLGFSAPRILAADLEQGFLLLEDLGDALFADVMVEAPDQEEALYCAALDVLVGLHHAKARPDLPVQDNRYHLKSYDEVALGIEADLLIDWYVPLMTGQDAHQDMRTSYHQAWQEVLPKMVVDNPVLVLRDYHAQNLLWLPEREGVARVGLLDFQDGVLGAPAYDVVSLLEDARRDVDPALAENMLRYYCDEMTKRDAAFDEDHFRMTYALLGAQRNAKIVGIFARLSARDGKPAYLELLPRVWRYLNHDLSHPALTTVKTWMDEHIPQSVRSEIPHAKGATS